VISEKLERQVAHIPATLERLDSQSRLIISALLQHDIHRTHVETVVPALTQLICRLDSANQDQHRLTRGLILKEQGNHPATNSTGHEPHESLQILRITHGGEAAARNKTKNIILQSLSYPGMSNRYEDIIEAFPNTFDWVFCDPTTTNLP